MRGHDSSVLASRQRRAVARWIARGCRAPSAGLSGASENRGVGSTARPRRAAGDPLEAHCEVLSRKRRSHAEAVERAQALHLERARSPRRERTEASSRAPGWRRTTRRRRKSRGRGQRPPALRAGTRRARGCPECRVVRGHDQLGARPPARGGRWPGGSRRACRAPSALAERPVARGRYGQGGPGIDQARHERRAVRGRPVRRRAPNLAGLGPPQPGQPLPFRRGRGSPATARLPPRCPGPGGCFRRSRR